MGVRGLAVHVSTPDGSKRGRNDDGADGTHSELIVTGFESGDRRIHVTALSDDTCNDTLTIDTQVSPPEPAFSWAEIARGRR